MDYGMKGKKYKDRMYEEKIKIEKPRVKRMNGKKYEEGRMMEIDRLYKRIKNH